jgi:hypothetical protein
MDNTTDIYRTENRKGKPVFMINWPQSEFTAEEIFRAMENKLSRVSVHSKINRAVYSGELEAVGEEKPKSGRPRVLYKRLVHGN